MNDRYLILSPLKVELNEILTVYAASGFFREIEYLIIDESGRTIRKGKIANNLSEFKLRIVGIRTGEYKLVMGKEQEKFVVS